MNFKQWLEVTDIATRPTDDIEFTIKQWDQQYTHEFEVDGKLYAIDIIKLSTPFWPTPFKILNIPCWDISFGRKKSSGMINYSTTNNAENKETVIYTRVLLAIKKFLETHAVEALSFSGYEKNMNLIYNRFFEKFLGKNFTNVVPDLYIKNDYLEQILSSMSPEERDSAEKNIIASQKKNKTFLQDIANKKKAARQEKFSTYPYSVGKSVIS